MPLSPFLFPLLALVALWCAGVIACAVYDKEG